MFDQKCLCPKNTGEKESNQSVEKILLLFSFTLEFVLLFYVKLLLCKTPPIYTPPKR